MNVLHIQYGMGDEEEICLCNHFFMRLVNHLIDQAYMYVCVCVCMCVCVNYKNEIEQAQIL